MAGSRIRIDVLGIGNVQRRLGNLAAAGRDLRPVFVRIGEYLVGSTKDRFKEQRAPSGAPWTPLSESYRERKPRNKFKILTLDGFLGSQISYRASVAELLVGSDRVYAGTHRFGAKKGSFGTTSRGSPIPWGDIPARPFLGLSCEDRDVVEGMVADYLEDAVDG
ncbi:MAG: phage virion morphogenesis protein [Gammaproteobacteria bacterium]|nr:phage virion morphogenesis protein [Gammaproteobacteria bacterium]MDE0282368.1 phage virion morphogenesis protein [Gammaproteobacteria bacterium]